MSPERVAIEASEAAAHGFELFPAHEVTLALNAEDWWDDNPTQPHVRAPANNKLVSALVRQLYYTS